jgi:hypothetical protein
VYGSHELTPGCGNWGKFMARWSAFLWNPRLQPVPNAAEQASVDKPALYWQPLMQEFVDTPTCKYKILHLVNPSGDDLIAKTTLPDPLQQVAVRIKLDAGAQAQRIVIVRPESEPYDVAVEPKMQDGRVEVVVPKANVWAMVILEESGTFTVPADKPAYTELPDPTKVAEGRILAGSALSNDPLQPPATGLKLAANEQLFETDAGYQNVPGQAASDPEANNGRAQIRADGTGFVYFGRTWMGPCLPGKYQLRIRLKLVDDKQPARNQSCVFEVYIGEKQHAEVIFDSDPKKVPADRHLIIDGKYHDYTVTEIDIHETAFFNVVGTARSVEPNAIPMPSWPPGTRLTSPTGCARRRDTPRRRLSRCAECTGARTRWTRRSPPVRASMPSRGNTRTCMHTTPWCWPISTCCSATSTPDACCTTSWPTAAAWSSSAAR